jgi:HEAT repeat protein
MPLFGPPDIEKLKSKRDIDGLVKALGYKKDSVVRCEAARALGDVGWYTTIDLLTPRLQDEDTNMRAAAAEALGKIRDQHISLIVQQGKDFTLGTFFLEALQKLEKNEAPVVEPLIQVLGSTEGRDRKGILAVLGALEDGRAVDAILALLKDSDASVRLSAIHALEEIGDRRAIDLLVPRLETSDLKIRKAVIHALDALGWSPSLDQWGALFLVGKRRWKECLKIGPPAVDALLEALRDEGLVRIGAIEVLGEIGDARAVEPLILTLNADKTEVRIAAIEALGRLGDVRAVDPLLSMLGEEEASVREAAVRTLGNFKEDRILDPLIARLKDRADEVRVEAVKALGSSGDTRSIEPLAAALLDETSRVRRSAVEALTTFNDLAVVPVLIQALGGWDQEILEKAAAALVRLADARAIEPLSKQLQTEEFARRSCAAQALVSLYRLAKLDQEQKQAILAWKPLITDKEHTDQQHPHNDQGSGSCHIDENASHTDKTYLGVDFPL